MTHTKSDLRILLLYGSGTEVERPASLTTESSVLTSLRQDATRSSEVNVISLGLSSAAAASTHLRLDEVTVSTFDRTLRALGIGAIRSRFATFSLGRLLNSLGPMDQGRIFWRTVKRSPSAIRLLKSADVVIATDVAAIKTAWIAVRRGWVDDAFYDHRSAWAGVGDHSPVGSSGD